MRKIVYQRPDGGVSIVTPAISSDDPPDFTEVQAEERAMTTAVPVDAMNPRFINDENIPADRTFRDAWRDTGTMVDVDMSRARMIHMNRIRVARDNELKKLDVEWIARAARDDTTGAAKTETKRQALREIPQTLDLSIAPDPVTLKVLWPTAIDRAS